MIHQRSRTFYTASQVVFAIGVVAAAWYNGSLALGVICAVFLVASVGVFQIASRRGHSIAGVLTGVGDERERSIYREATYRTAETFMYALAIWGVASVAQGDENPTLIIVLSGYGALWLANLAWVSWQSRHSAGHLEG
jgi:uncharacterized membrane protein